MPQKSPEKLSLCIAMVAPIGVDLDLIENLIVDKISNLKIYPFVRPPGKQASHKESKILTNEVINISDLFPRNRSNIQDIYKQIEGKMDNGDAIRKKYQDESVLASKIANKIKQECFTLIHQLKTPQEINYLRNYLNKKNIPFFVISVFDTKENRIKKLQLKLKLSEEQINGKNASINSLAQNLIDRDEKDMQEPFGQNVGDAFSLADFFIDASFENTISSQADRIVKAIFGYPHISPTLEEYGMYLAEGCGLRSRDLSRQVGASILDNKGSVLSLGCNEVPKAFGGCYWEKDITDNRDFILNIDSNYNFRNQTLEELFLILSLLPEFKPFKDKLKKISSKKGLQEFLKENKRVFKNTRIMNLIEFGRSEHAEVGAISDAARKGISLEAGILFTTVFPCHLCARYIIASGIKKVVFIEPYPKSLTLDLYFREMTLSPNSECSNKIIMEPFIGIAPRIYRKIFIYDKYINTDKKDEEAHPNSWYPNLINWTHSLPTIERRPPSRKKNPPRKKKK